MHSIRIFKQRALALLRFLTLSLCMALVWSSSYAQSVREKPRVYVLTDIENEPDDTESLVRFMTYTNQFEVEGLVATTSVHLRDHVAPDSIRSIVKAYGAVRANLILHEPGFPTEDYLMSIVYSGAPSYGMTAVGKGAISQGAEQLIKVVDRKDPRPVWVLAWGGTNTLAQALNKIKATRSKAALKQFVKKLRVYTISDQDDAGHGLDKRFRVILYSKPGHAYWRCLSYVNMGWH